MIQICKSLFFLCILGLFVEPTVFGTEYIQTVLGYIVMVPVYIVLTLASGAGALLGWIAA